MTKDPFLSALKCIFLVKLYAKSEKTNKKKIYSMIKNLLSKRNNEFENNIDFSDGNVFCEFIPKILITKCKIRIKLKSRNECHETHCSESRSKENLLQSLKNDLNKIKSLLKVAENELQNESKELIKIGIRDIKVRTNFIHYCPKGHYFDRNRCRE